jgi:hypothetical protein
VSQLSAATASDRFRVRLLLVLAAAVIVPVGATVLYSFPPTEYGFYPRCFFFMLTGLHCPGCGATRCVHALLHGEVEQALAYNALFVLFSPFLLILGLHFAYTTWRGRPSGGRLPAGSLYLLLIVLVAFWILRNIDIYPLSLLAPHPL